MWKGKRATTSAWAHLVLAAVMAAGFLYPARLPARAQDAQPQGPVYIVQEGDSLWDISLRFRVSMDALANANGITDPNQVSVGSQLVIPGLEGVQGVLTTEQVVFGETLRSLSRRYRTTETTLARLNHLTSPAELYPGASLVVPQNEGTAASIQRASLAAGQSLLELAVVQGKSPWQVAASNAFSETWTALPGEVLQLPAANVAIGEAEDAGGLPAVIQAAKVEPDNLEQGRALVLKLQGPDGLALSGEFIGHALQFFPDGQGWYVALQGIHAMTEPGLYPLRLNGSLPDGSTFAFSQNLLVQAGNYRFDPDLAVRADTIDPAVTRPEDAEWLALAASFSPQKLWDGIFLSPAPPPFDECWPSLFGNRRSYNGSGYKYFHSGLDFCGGVGTKIRAPASGVVVFAGPLTVRGNATMIDHGWGIYTGYMHQSEILVKVGDRVDAGDVIGLVGGTGRVTGPHLHWEVFAGGVQVDPMEWLKREIP